MDKFKKYIELNKICWDQRTALHLNSNFYDNNKFIINKNSLNSIELNMLGDYVLGSGIAQTTLTDPVSYTQDYEGGIHVLAGAQFKLGFLRIFGEVTTAEYTTFNGGIGIGVRN